MKIEPLHDKYGRDYRDSVTMTSEQYVPGWLSAMFGGHRGLEIHFWSDDHKQTPGTGNVGDVSIILADAPASEMAATFTRDEVVALAHYMLERVGAETSRDAKLAIKRDAAIAALPEQARQRLLNGNWNLMAADFGDEPPHEPPIPPQE